MTYEASGRFNVGSFIEQNSDNRIPVRTLSLSPYQSQLRIDSDDRQAGTAINNFLMTKKNSNHFSLKLINRMALTFVQYPFLSPTISLGRNDTLIIRDQIGGLHTGTLPEGWYTYQEFVAALNTLLTAGMTPALAPLVITATLTSDIDGNRLSLVSNQIYQFVQDTSRRRDLAAVMGYGLRYGDFIGLNSLTDLQLYYTRYVQIVSNELSKFQKVKVESSDSFSANVLVRLFPDRSFQVQPPATDAYTVYSRPVFQAGGQQNVQVFEWQDQELQNIDFSVTDEFGDLVYLRQPVTNTFPWTLNFIVEQVN